MENGVAAVGPRNMYTAWMPVKYWNLGGVERKGRPFGDDSMAGSVRLFEAVVHNSTVGQHSGWCCW